MMESNTIGLDTTKTAELAKRLNDLLANYQVFYMNVRGYHWNIKGEKFFELHTKFEELYNDLLVKVDEVAERVLTLGHKPTDTFSAYLDASEIAETRDVSNGIQAVQHILDAFKILLTKQREVLSLSDTINDEGTNALMSDYIREQEKLVWMYSAFLSSN